MLINRVREPALNDLLAIMLDEFMISRNYFEEGMGVFYELGFSFTRVTKLIIIRQGHWQANVCHGMLLA
ncbi:hypothetical protein D3C77_726900 [compost metagenome]